MIWFGSGVLRFAGLWDLPLGSGVLSFVGLWKFCLWVLKGSHPSLCLPRCINFSSVFVSSCHRPEPTGSAATDSMSLLWPPSWIFAPSHFCLTSASLRSLTVLFLDEFTLFWIPMVLALQHRQIDSFTCLCSGWPILDTASIVLRRY